MKKRELMYLNFFDKETHEDPAVATDVTAERVVVVVVVDDDDPSPRLVCPYLQDDFQDEC